VTPILQLLSLTAAGLSLASTAFALDGQIQIQDIHTWMNTRALTLQRPCSCISNDDSNAKG
jgi:hypothetical protein